MSSINLSALPEEELLFLRRLRDLADISAAKYISRFTLFLTERQQRLAEEFIRQIRINKAVLFGGYGEAVRKQCGFFPVSEDPEEEQFPLIGITAKYPSHTPLSHRDFLGSLMGLGIKRESIGDILPGEGFCTLFLAESIAEYVLQELIKVGNTGVSCSQGFDPARIPMPSFRDIAGTVGSARLDSLVKLLTNLAREKSANLIRGGLVRRNDGPAESVSMAFEPGDTVTIRGYGKFIVDSVGGPTRKGRLPVRARQYL